MLTDTPTCIHTLPLSLSLSSYGKNASTDLAAIMSARGVGYTVGTLGMGWVMTSVPDQRHYLLVVCMYVCMCVVLIKLN